METPAFSSIGPDYLAIVLGAPGRPAVIRDYEEEKMHSQHVANPEIKRIKMTVEREGRVETLSLVAKHLTGARGGHEVRTWLWIRKNTNLRLPHLHAWSDGSNGHPSWLLSENLLNSIDWEFYDVACRFFPGPPKPSAEDPFDVNWPFLDALAEWHGKTLYAEWPGTVEAPVCIYRPRPPFAISSTYIATALRRDDLSFRDKYKADLIELGRLSDALPAETLCQYLERWPAVSHGWLNYQEIGLRPQGNGRPQCILFDYETIRIASVACDLAQLHFQMWSGPVSAAQLDGYLRKLRALSGMEINPVELRLAMRASHIIESLNDVSQFVRALAHISGTDDYEERWNIFSGRNLGALLGHLEEEATHAGSI